MFNFGDQSTPSRFQEYTQSNSPFNYQPSVAAFEVDAMYLADPSANPNIAPLCFTPHTNTFHNDYSIEEIISQNSLIRKFGPHEVELGEVIGAGFFGQVHKGRLMSGQIVALKKVLKQRFRDKNDVQIFSQEMEILSKVSHNCIVALYGVALLSDNCFSMVMEFMSGGTLRSFIDKMPHAINNDRRLGIVRRIAEGMNYLHNWQPEPILHRDLSSVNILLDNNANAKICDFGLSRIKAAGNKSMTTAVGSAAWMAPEVWMSGNYDQKADVYSFAIVTWELCTFGDPCCGLVPDVYASKVALEAFRPPLTDNINSDWRSLIMACWTHDPRQRPGFGQILREISK